MADFAIKQGDQLPSIEATLTGADGNIANLTDMTVAFAMRSSDGLVRRSGAAAIVNATVGQVRYDWQAGDTAVAGTYRAEFQIRQWDGKLMSFPNDRYLSVVVMERA